MELSILPTFILYLSDSSEAALCAAGSNAEHPLRSGHPYYTDSGGGWQVRHHNQKAHYVTPAPVTSEGNKINCLLSILNPHSTPLLLQLVKHGFIKTVKLRFIIYIVIFL